jgi:hypothetical protein
VRRIALLVSLLLLAPVKAKAQAVPSAAEPPAAAAPASAEPPETEVAKLREAVARQERELAEQRAQVEQLKHAAEAGAAVEASTAGQASDFDKKLSLYGFMDIGFQKAVFNRASGLNNFIESDASTFVLGNVNLYLDARPVQGWRALTEVRFTNYPNGQYTVGAPGQPFQRTNTQVFDVNSASGGFAQTHWGAIVLERAQVEWSGADWFNVRAGYWFTPYGLWNVDHGTPTLISLNVPQFVVFEAFPARQLGVDLYGTFHAGAWDLDYNAYVSNGRTPGQLDPSEDKMFGGRLALSRTQPFAMALGLSGFHGR